MPTPCPLCKGEQNEDVEPCTFCGGEGVVSELFLWSIWAKHAQKRVQRAMRRLSRTMRKIEKFLEENE